ncbi:hypothetical protein T4C_6595 [Trichinella pseudospiralis]|uniref:Uncharacterized protein n=1 Tax=Trichinella pseudospiralis TaxID=6337 RepID=A0A0V1GIC3_TRIPS|nr:hypothetical protein T4C_6595 [Trichinella pseudospiralis]
MAFSYSLGEFNSAFPLFILHCGIGALVYLTQWRVVALRNVL